MCARFSFLHKRFDSSSRFFLLSVADTDTGYPCRTNLERPPPSLTRGTTNDNNRGSVQANGSSDAPICETVGVPAQKDGNCIVQNSFAGGSCSTTLVALRLPLCGAHLSHYHSPDLASNPELSSQIYIGNGDFAHLVRKSAFILFASHFKLSLHLHREYGRKASMKNEETFVTLNWNFFLLSDANGRRRRGWKARFCDKVQPTRRGTIPHHAIRTLSQARTFCCQQSGANLAQ
jgi:hypothetical protein